MTREEAIHFAECLKHNWTIDFNDMEDFCDLAISALQAEIKKHHVIDKDTGQWGILVNKANVITELSALPSADANPTVVRCKTMIPYGDFREWAKRIREDNPNVIVIPFDAEVASADAVQGEWIFNTDENNGKSWNICSVCGYSIFHTTNYCPNCGARMKGGDSE